MLLNHMNEQILLSSGNDYAVAKALNESVDSLFSIIAFFQVVGTLKEFDPLELNRMYILLVFELETLYDRNPKLTVIKPEPIWRHFEIIKDKLHDVEIYALEESNSSRSHLAQVEKLCILSGEELPVFTDKQKKFIDDTKKLSKKYGNLILEEVKKLPVDESLNRDTQNVRVWCIKEYIVTYKLDGTILINNVLRLKKIHAGSTVERLMEQAVKNPNILFKPDLGQTARNLSTVLSSAGFTPILRQLFFPIISDDKGIISRPIVTREETFSERIDTSEIDKILFELGAEIAVRPNEELVALGIAAPDEPD